MDLVAVLVRQQSRSRLLVLVNIVVGDDVLDDVLVLVINPGQALVREPPLLRALVVEREHVLGRVSVLRRPFVVGGEVKPEPMLARDRCRDPVCAHDAVRSDELAHINVEERLLGPV